MENQPQAGASIEFGPFAFDAELGKLYKHGTSIRLRGMPLKILQHLVKHPGEVVPRGELQKLLWEGAAFGDFEQGLNTAVNVVRKTLGDSADQPRYIETIPSQGYRFIAPVRSPVAAPADADQVVPSESAGEKSAAPRSRWWIIAAAFVLAALAGGVWWTYRSKTQRLIDGSLPSANREANDQYNLAYNFLAFQNDIPLARRTFQRALELDPDFASARLQRALAVVLDIYNGYANDGSILYQAEDDVHRAERALPGSDGLLLAAQTGVYLAQGRLDRIPKVKLQEQWSRTGKNPTWLVVLRMLEGQTEEPVAILRERIERDPLENVSRMFLGEFLRLRGDTAGAIQTLQRAMQQGPGHPTAAWFLTMAYLDAGKPEQARVLLEGMRPGFEKNYMWRHAWAILLAAEGKRKKALEAMDEGTLRFARLTWTATSPTADFYALLDDRSQAIEWLQFAAARGDERVSYFRRNPRLATLRIDMRFQSILKSVEARRK